MDSKLDAQAASEKIVHITTYDSDNTPGTVAMWFYPMSGKIYMSTARDSVKTKRIALNPRVGLQFRDRKAPIVEGRASVVSEENIIRGASEGLFSKYEGGGVWWDSLEHMVRGFLKHDPSVLLEITLEDP